MWLALVGCGSSGSDGVPPPGDPPDRRVFDDEHVLVVPHHRGLTLLRADGSAAWEEDWDGLVGECPLCGGEGASADGDGLLVALTTNGLFAGGAVARIGSSGTLDWRLDGFVFPHDAVRDPADGAVVVDEATVDRITWVPGDGSSPDPVRALDDHDATWPGDTPNGLDRVDDGDRTWLVVSHRGDGSADSGQITTWDVTDPDAPTLAWTFPPAGGLGLPHGAVLRRYDGRWWLVWAHSAGQPDGSTVGLAVTDDPAVAPRYVADLVPAAPVGPFVFLRGVELTDDGWLWLTDSGEQTASSLVPGRIVSAPMPALEPTGAGGAVGEDQVLVPLDGAEVVADGFEVPFEGWLWRPTF